ncbi:MAG: 16S rRNA (adenine(1518)-N(6)/adenine(1519)-N(6))-dimethyltransferase RsmA [Thermodesulfobacteriota bacterium]
MNRHLSEGFKSRKFAARKRFGQNFLVDKNIIAKIVAAADIRPGDVVIEIGPGMGALTDALAISGANVIAIELDRDLVEELKEKYSDIKDIEIICADALKVSYAEIAKRLKKKLKVVANIPYNISTPILFKLFKEREVFTALLLMLQKEVAERVVAVPGKKDYGALSVFSQFFADVNIEFQIPPTAFYPVPKVYSSIVRFDILDKPRVEVEDMEIFKRVVKAAFGMRRKMILNALKVLGLPGDILRSLLLESAIDPRSRGETIDIDRFGYLSNLLSKQIKNVLSK